jgi:hypothetical protein
MAQRRLEGKVAVITGAALALDGGYSASGPMLCSARKVES